MKIPTLLQFSTFRKYSARRVIFFWYRNYKKLFFLGFLLVLGVGGWVWYYSVHAYSWTEEQKKAYLAEYFQETSFKEAKFQSLTESLQVRAESHQNGISLSRQLFTGEALGGGE